MNLWTNQPSEKRNNYSELWTLFHFHNYEPSMGNFRFEMTNLRSYEPSENECLALKNTIGMAKNRVWGGGGVEEKKTLSLPHFNQKRRFMIEGMVCKQFCEGSRERHF